MLTGDLIALFVGAAVALGLGRPARALCEQVGLVDSPSKRKRHVGRVPLAGGLLVLAGTLAGAAASGMSGSVSNVTVCLIVVLPLLFLMGAIDDKYDMPARLRLILQGGVCLGIVLAFGIQVTVLDSIVGGEPVVLGVLLSVIFSVFCMCGVLNATNMVDGLDGLLGSVAVISLLGIAALSVDSGNTGNLGTALAAVGAMLGYLCYNLGLFGAKNKMFLGDSGSLVIGVVLVVLLVDGAQPNGGSFTPTSAGWLLGLPLVDVVSVVLRRVLRGQPPLAAGRDHLHHLLQDLGLSRRKTLYALATLQLGMVLVGVSANFVELPQAVFFWGFVGLTVAVFVGSVLADGVLARQNIKIVDCSSARYLNDPGVAADDILSLPAADLAIRGQVAKGRESLQREPERLMESV